MLQIDNTPEYSSFVSSLAGGHCVSVPDTFLALACPPQTRSSLVCEIVLAL